LEWSSGIGGATLLAVDYVCWVQISAGSGAGLVRVRCFSGSSGAGFFGCSYVYSLFGLLVHGVGVHSGGLFAFWCGCLFLLVLLYFHCEWLARVLLPFAVFSWNYVWLDPVKGT